MHAMKKNEDIIVLHDEPMSKHTSWRAGGVAKNYVQAVSLEALASFIKFLPDEEEILWLGLGSNTLVRDGGFNGTVIATHFASVGFMSQLEIIDEANDTVSVYVGAGVTSAKLAKFCAKHGLAGAEFFAGIPGLVGGALAMNAGAFGGETWPLVTEVETLNRSGLIQKRSAGEFDYTYRSVKGLAGGSVGSTAKEWFVSATLKLTRRQGVESNTIEIKQLLAKRAATQPTGVASCGSVFRNPEGYFAAQLIEDCGLKGRRIGGAVISRKHANFIINDNNSSAKDIEMLIKLIQEEVKQKHGITLRTEARIVGEPISEPVSEIDGHEGVQ